jgi:pyruvate ferredoxin oxidoreductase gamma subunit
MIEIVWHGRGGMGVVTASELTASAALYNGKYSQSMPIFGPERTGAPFKAYARISNNLITIKTSVYNPDIAVFMDSSLLTREALKGLKKGGIVIINSPYAYKINDVNVYYLDATKISIETINKSIVSTAMAGATLKVTQVATLEDLIKAIEERFEGEIAQKNIEAAKKAYENVKVI